MPPRARPSIGQQYFHLLCPWEPFQHDATPKCKSFLGTYLESFCPLSKAHGFADQRALRPVEVHSSFSQIAEAGGGSLHRLQISNKL